MPFVSSCESMQKSRRVEGAYFYVLYLKMLVGSAVGCEIVLVNTLAKGGTF